MRKLLVVASVPVALAAAMVLVVIGYAARRAQEGTLNVELQVDDDETRGLYIDLAPLVDKGVSDGLKAKRFAKEIDANIERLLSAALVPKEDDK